MSNAFKPTSEVQNIENGVFQNVPFADDPFTNGHFPNRGCSCLCAKLPNDKVKKNDTIIFIDCAYLGLDSVSRRRHVRTH